MNYLKGVLLLLLCLMAGCGHQPRTYPASSGSACSSQEMLKATDLKSLFKEVAVDICADNFIGCQPGAAGGGHTTDLCAEKEGARPTTVLVTDFVDLNSFIPKQTGLIMGELMRGALSSVCHYKIVQAEFAAYFKLSENGLVSLTRQSSEIKNDEYQQDEAVVGTYNYLSGNKLLIFVKKINTGTSRISRMVTKELDYTCSDNVVVSYTVK